MRLHTAFIICVSLGAVPAAAQDLTDQQLLKLFSDQRDAFKAVKENGLGKTRGLTLVTVDSANQASTTENAASAGSAATSAAATTPATSGDTTAATTAGTGQATVKPVVFGELAPELQVNVNIKFGFDSAALTPDQIPRLAQLCSVMKASDIQLFRIVGHTDASGTDAYNQKLSQLRADEVRRYLVNDCGIAKTRLEALGMGEHFLADKKNPDAPENRRVEFQALS